MIAERRGGEYWGARRGVIDWCKRGADRVCVSFEGSARVWQQRQHGVMKVACIRLKRSDLFKELEGTVECRRP